MTTAGQHGVLALAQRDSSAALFDAAPRAVLEQLREAAGRVARRSLFLTGELCALLDALDAAGIPTVAFKGPALAMVLYGDAGMRQFGDLDVLVHPPDVARASQLLLARGYRPRADVPPGDEAAELASQHHRRLVRGDGTIVELHWALAPRESLFPLDADEVWSRLEPVRLGARIHYTLGGEDLALFLCAHGAKHLWERLEWLCDLAALLARRPGLDWDAMLARARRRGAERIVLLALHLAHELLGAPVPDGIRARARANRAVRFLGERVRARLFAGPHPPTLREARVFHWHVRERWRDRLRSLAHVLFTPGTADRQAVRLPAPLTPLYYVIRPVRLVVRYGWQFARQ